METKTHSFKEKEEEKEEGEYDGSCPGELSVVTEPIYRVKLSIGVL